MRKGLVLLAHISWLGTQPPPSFLSKTKPTHTEIFMKVACTVLYLIPRGFILLRALRELPTWMGFITLDDEVSNLLPRSGRERGPHSFTPLLCYLHNTR